MADLVVLAPLVIATDTSGQMHHLYRGAIVGDAFSKEERKRLQDAEMIGVEGAKPKKATSSVAADSAPASEDQGPTPPAGNASTEEWATYAVSSGQATEDEVQGMKQSELRDKYGK
jgi:hypothetical protein